MQSFTYFDGGVALVLLVSAILAYNRGLIRETMAIGGWIAAAIVGFVFAPWVTPIVHEIPIVRDIIGSSCELAVLSAFIVTFILALILVSVLVLVLAGTIRNSALGGIDQLLGLGFGLIRGLLLVLVILIVHDRIVPEGDGIVSIENSLSREILTTSQDGLEALIPDNAPGWIIDRYNDLMGSCRTGETGFPDLSGGENAGVGGGGADGRSPAPGVIRESGEAEANDLPETSDQ